MRNIFKTFTENKQLHEENDKLRVQIEALTAFRKSFESFYEDITSVSHIIHEMDSTTITLMSVIDRAPIESIKLRMERELASKLIPFIKYDVEDDWNTGEKVLRGVITVAK